MRLRSLHSDWMANQDAQVTSWQGGVLRLAKSDGRIAAPDTCLTEVNFNEVARPNVTLHTKTRLIKHGNLGETGFPKGFQRVSNSRNWVCKGPPNGL